MAHRKKIPKTVETAVLVKSRRRCCLCYHLSGEFSEKKGQIAHLDHNPSNNDEDNLAFLCFDHHDQFDSKTSQAKGLTAQEVRHAREQLSAQLGASTASTPPYDRATDQELSSTSHQRLPGYASDGLEPALAANERATERPEPEARPCDETIGDIRVASRPASEYYESQLAQIRNKVSEVDATDVLCMDVDLYVRELLTKHSWRLPTIDLDNPGKYTVNESKGTVRVRFPCSGSASILRYRPTSSALPDSVMFVEAYPGGGTLYFEIPNECESAFDATYSESLDAVRSYLEAMGPEVETLNLQLEEQAEKAVISRRELLEPTRRVMEKYGAAPAGEDQTGRSASASAPLGQTDAAGTPLETSTLSPCATEPPGSTDALIRPRSFNFRREAIDKECLATLAVWPMPTRTTDMFPIRTESREMVRSLFEESDDPLGADAINLESVDQQLYRIGHLHSRKRREVIVTVRGDIGVGWPSSKSVSNLEGKSLVAISKLRHHLLGNLKRCHAAYNAWNYSGPVGIGLVLFAQGTLMTLVSEDDTDTYHLIRDTDERLPWALGGHASSSSTVEELHGEGLTRVVNHLLQTVCQQFNAEDESGLPSRRILETNPTHVASEASSTTTRSQTTSSGRSGKKETEGDSLQPIQQQILKSLASAGGSANIGLFDLKQVVARFHLDALRDMELVRRDQQYDYSLTKKGREFVVENGLI